MITSGSSGIGRDLAKPAAGRHDAAMRWSAGLRGLSKSSILCRAVAPRAYPSRPLLSIQQQRTAGPSAERVLESN